MPHPTPRSPGTVFGVIPRSLAQRLKNVYFDTAVVCESPALEAIINTFGHDHLLYGSDFPVTHSRGRAVTLVGHPSCTP